MNYTTRFCVLIALVLVHAAAARAATLDDFGGDTAVSCPAPIHQVTATCSQRGTTVTCTVPSGDGANYGFQEPIMLSGSGTALDYVFVGTSATANADIISTVSGTTLTMTAPTSQTVSHTSITLKPARFYTATITTPFGTGPQLCTPEGHWFWAEMISAPCSTIVAGQGGCGLNIATSASSQTGGVVTQAMAGGTNNHITLGMNVTITGCVDTTYNGNFQVTSLTTNTFTYNDNTTNGSTTGCAGTGFGWDPPKYSGSQSPQCNSGIQMMFRYKTMGFNATGDDSQNTFLPLGGCTISSGSWLPMFTPITSPGFSRYPSDNYRGCGAQAVHVPSFTVDRAITGLQNMQLLDWFDPNWPTAIQCGFGPQGAAGSQETNFAESPFLIGQTPDDSDGMVETRGGPIFHSNPAGKNAPNPALLVSLSAPQISLSDAPLYPNSSPGSGNAPFFFSVDTVWSKNLSSTAPSSCSDTSPCSWPDFLRNKYGTVAALNTAWGSSYTTFGSSQAVFTGETVTTPSSYTFAHSNVTPRSVQVYLTPSGGSSIMVTGDCQNNAIDCLGGTAGAAQFLAPTACANNTNYFTAGIQCTDSNGDVEEITTGGTSGGTPTWPATNNCSGTQTTTSKGVAFTCIGPKITGTITYSTGVAAFTIGGGGSLASGETLTVSYTTGGWSVGGTGVEDEDGSNSWTTTNGVCLVAPATFQPGTSYTGYADSSLISANVSGSNTWQLAINTFTSGASAPTFSSTAGTLSSDANWVSLGNPVSDAKNGDFKVACPANTTQHLNYANDLNAWLEQFVSEYAETYNAQENSFWPDLLNFGTNFSSMDWANPTWSAVLKAFNQFADAGFWGEFANGNQESTIDPTVPYKENYSFTYFQKPTVVEEFEGSSSGWEGNTNCSDIIVNCWNGLVARGQGFYSQLNEMLHYKAPNGSVYFAGVTWWTDHTGNAAQSGSFGLLDSLDNRLDGVENVTSTVSCDAPLGTLSCGGEVPSAPWVGVNEETCSQCLIPALALWDSGALPPPPASPVAPTKRVIFVRRR